MNTLNNQQINPGNRVDFSKIRSNIKVQKFETPSGPLYNYDDLETGLANEQYIGGTSTKGLTQNTTTDVTSLESSQAYIDFTNYIMGLTNPTSSDLAYLKAVDKASNPNVSQLFTDTTQTTLKEGWQSIFQNLRTDGTAGPFHYTPAKLNGSAYAEPPVEETSLYATPTVIPKYRHSLWTDPYHLAAIYGNNIRGAIKTANLATKYKAPTVQAPQYDEVVTDAYNERTANEQAVADARARYAEMASNTSNADSARQIMQDFESQVAVPAQIKNNAIQANEFATTTQNVQKIRNLNHQLRTGAANENHQAQVAEYNNRLLAKQKLNAAVTAETSDLIQKLDASFNQHIALEKSNMNHYNTMVNQHMYNQGIKETMLKRDQALQDVVQSTQYQDVIQKYFRENGYSKMDGQDKTTVLQDPNNLDTVLPILQRYSHLPPIRNLISTIIGAQNAAQKEFERTVVLLQNQLAEANLYTRAQYSSSPGYRRDALDVNWRTLFPSNLKKGGKVEDRLLKYLEHNRKVLKDQQERNAFAQKQANTKLMRELDSLDRETLLLLRSIFK